MDLDVGVYGRVTSPRNGSMASVQVGKAHLALSTVNNPSKLNISLSEEFWIDFGQSKGFIETEAELARKMLNCFKATKFGQ